MLDKMLASSFQWHNYGKTTIGARSDIENVPIERLQAFYRNYYQPDNAVLIVAGKLDEAKTVNGKMLKVKVNSGNVMIDDATVTSTDIAASNGVIHVIDSVMIPKAA